MYIRRNSQAGAQSALARKSQTNKFGPSHTPFLLFLFSPSTVYILRCVNQLGLHIVACWWLFEWLRPSWISFRSRPWRVKALPFPKHSLCWGFSVKLHGCYVGRGSYILWQTIIVLLDSLSDVSCSYWRCENLSLSTTGWFDLHHCKILWLWFDLISVVTSWNRSSL